MKLRDLFNRKRNKTVLIVQCRLSSTRLPGKALLPLGGKTVLEWVLASMKKVKADRYYLAVDEKSCEQLAPIALKCGWDFFAGSETDVLDRFCNVIKMSKADTVIRATADNPFLFYEAAQSLAEEYDLRNSTANVDYITYTGLPHGSGVEMFNAHSLLKAASMTSLDYDHEHVGPALYNHPDSFNSLFVRAPARFCRPELRSTIDTAADYRRALAVVQSVSKGGKCDQPYTCEQILQGLDSYCISSPVLFIPSVECGRGTGHLRRCLELAEKTISDVYIPEDCTLAETEELLDEARKNGLFEWQIVRNFDSVQDYSMVVTDMFKTPDSLLKKIPRGIKIVALDEGRTDTSYADFVIDVIPSADSERVVNISDPSYMELPLNRRNSVPSCVKKAIVVLGGEDPSNLTVPAAKALAELGIYVTAVMPSQKTSDIPDGISSEQAGFIAFVPPVENLREKLFGYDLVVTHYGFTAFEASAAGCPVILLGTSPLHEKLAKKYSFACLAPSSVTKEKFASLLENPATLVNSAFSEGGKSLSECIISLSKGTRLMCPVCRSRPEHDDAVVARVPERTFRRCSSCGIIYMSWKPYSRTDIYGRSYFTEEYKKQYGKTYLDDFASIKAQCVRRVSIIDFIYRRQHSSVTPVVLDVGCAMGPFLDAANDSGWQVFGTDISAQAVDYVQKTLNYPAVCGSFPDVDLSAEFGIEKFDAVTMWYVLEHFENADAVLKAVSSLLKKGGIFAFSTPSASGISAKFNTEEFYASSPADHYTLWETGRVEQILHRYGFKVVKIVPTGIHPERFPCVKNKNLSDKSLKFKLLGIAAKMMRLGDTFEVYCRKI